MPKNRTAFWFIVSKPDFRNPSEDPPIAPLSNPNRNLKTFSISWKLKIHVMSLYPFTLYRGMFNPQIANLQIVRNHTIISIEDICLFLYIHDFDHDKDEIKTLTPKTVKMFKKNANSLTLTKG